MQDTNRRIEAENQKGEGVIFEKRVFDLAKQAVAGLHGENPPSACIYGFCHAYLYSYIQSIPELRSYTSHCCYCSAGTFYDLALCAASLNRNSQVLA